jgi:GntR family transcriptional regulator, galactonate operon transcriptional repressor
MLKSTQDSTVARPLKRNLREQVVDSIGSEIVGGQLRPGEFLPAEGVLVARYEVSRTVLREAVNVLSGKGLLDARPKRGTIVRPRSEWSLLDPAVLAWRGNSGGADEFDDVGDTLDRLMEVRRIIEPGAAAVAARRGSTSDFARIEAAYEAMAKAGMHVDAFMEADLAFHVACLVASQNEFLLPVAHAIRTAMMTSLRITNRNPTENRNVSLPLHRAILDAILARDSEAAALAMKRHLDDTERRRVRAGPRVKQIKKKV